MREFIYHESTKEQKHEKELRIKFRAFRISFLRGYV